MEVLEQPSTMAEEAKRKEKKDEPTMVAKPAPSAYMPKTIVPPAKRLRDPLSNCNLLEKTYRNLEQFFMHHA